MNLNYILRRRALLLQSNKLPRGYVPLDYIESSGVQYIDTGYIHKSYNLKTEIIAQWVGEIPRAFETLYGFMGNGASYSPRTGIHKWSGTLMFGTNDTNTTSIVPDKNIHKYTQTSKWTGENINGVQSLNDNGVNLQFNTGVAAAGDIGWDTNKLSMYLFARNTSGAPNNYAHYRMYSFKFWDEKNKLIFNMIPCLNPDGMAGMYDLVGGKFYDSATAHKFIAGNRIVNLPEGYQQVEYIENTSYAYIDTQFHPNPKTTDLNMVFSMSVIPSNYMQLFGSRESTAYTDTFANFNVPNSLGIRIDEVGQIAVMYRLNTKSTINILDNVVTMNSGDISVIETGKNTRRDIYHTLTTTFIFAICESNGKPNAYLRGNQKLYGFTIKDNGVLARDYIPCINPSGEVGLYDLVEKKFYGSADPNYKFVAGESVMKKDKYVEGGLMFYLDGRSRGEQPDKWIDKKSGIVFDLVNCTSNENNVQFNSLSSYGINTANVGQLDYNQNECTIEAVYETASNDYLVFHGSANGSLCLGSRNQNGLFYEYQGGSRAYADTSSDKYIVSLNSLFAYKNQTKLSTTNNLGCTPTNHDNMIGCRTPGNFTMIGKLYAIRIYNRHLSEQEMIHNQQLDEINYFSKV